MQEKAESDMAFREEELKIRKKEEETKAAQFQAMFTQQQSFLQAMTQQQAQQQQQNQHMQMLMAQQNQAMMSVFEITLVKRVTQKSHISVSFHLNFTARSVRLKGMWNHSKYCSLSCVLESATVF